MLAVTLIFLAIAAVFAAAGAFLPLTALAFITGLVAVVAIGGKVHTRNSHTESPAFSTAVVMMSIVAMLALWIAFLVVSL